MNGMYMKAIVAGVFFGIWPLLMNRSGLSGNMSATVFTIFALITVFPLAMYEGFGSLRTAIPFFYITAGITAGVGLIAFNSMLSGATPKQLGSLFLVSMMAQIAVPAIYHMFLNGVEMKKVIGIMLAVCASVLLV